MKIGILASLAQPIHPLSTGGTEVFCYLLAKGLIQQGHSVYLLASGDSNPPPGVDMVPVTPHSMVKTRMNFMEKFEHEMNADEKRKITDMLNTRMLFLAKQYETEIDIFHDNTSSPLTGSISNIFAKPFITTTHMPPVGFAEYIELPKLITQPNNHYVTVAKWQQKYLSFKTDQVYNGIDIEQYSFNPNGDNPLIWIGRISAKTPHKGLLEAIKVSEETGKELRVAGSISDQYYFDEQVRPHLKSEMINGNFSSYKEKSKFLGVAKLALFPITWEEPFGFVFVEAMATGTPVVAFARGAVPEVIMDGVTGFIINPSDDDIRGDFIIKKTGLAGIREAVEKIYSMSQIDYQNMRKNARQHVETNFTYQKMASNYVDVYNQYITD